MAQSSQPKHSHRRLVQRSIVLCLGLLLLPWLAGRARAWLTPQAQPQASNPTPVIYPSTVGLTPQDALPIEPGKLIERELPGESSHFYRVSLTAGQCLNIVAEQFDANVRLGIYGPDGQLLIELNNWSEGLETLCRVAKATGIHQIEVETKKTYPGRYRIRIEELRPATPRDLLLAAAYLAHYEGAELRNGDSQAESQQKALKKLQEALPLWREAGERRMEAATLLNLAWVYDSLNEYQKMLEVGEQALALREVASDRYWELCVLLSIGEAHHFLGEYQQALKFAEQALPICQAQGNPTNVGWALHYCAAAYSALGDKQKALEIYQDSLRAYQAGTNKNGVAVALTGMGGVYVSLGEWENALAALRQALPYWIPQPDNQPDPREARTHNLIGEIYAAQGEFQRAIESYQQALRIWHTAGDRWGESYVLNNLGRLHASLGQYQRARLALNQALQLRRDITDRRGQAYTLTYLGALHHSLGSPQKALGFYHEALPISQDIGDREGQALTHYHLARALRDLGQMKEARTQIEAALKLIEDIRANVLGQELRASYLASVRNYYEFYVDLLMRLHQREPLARFDAEALHASEKARARSLFETLAEARVDIRRDMDPQLAARERGLEQQISAKNEYRIHLLTSPRTAEQATTTTKEIDALIAKLCEVKARIRALNPRSQPEPLDAAEIQRLLDPDTLLLEYAIGEERSYLWAVTPTTIASYALPKRAVIERAARRFYELLTTRNRSVKHETPAQRQARRDRADAQALQAAAALSRMLLGPAAAQLGTKRLLIAAEGALQYVPFAALPKPVGSRQWAVGSSSLQRTTDHGQRTTNQRRLLIEDHEIVTLPSASTLAMLRRDADSRQRAPKIIAVLADPVFTADDERVQTNNSNGQKPSASSTERLAHKLPSDLERALRDLGVTGPELRIQRLPGTRREAEQIMNLVPASESMQALDFAASRATAIDLALSQYRILHFATHALIDSARPDLSGIVLSLVNERGEPQEGFLRAPEIFNLKLRADLAVLSACQTGLGKEVKGEGLVGLTQSFMYAGAPRVLVSLWSLNDKATAELMAKFYQHLLGPEHLSPAAALRAAQIEMSKDAPYFWAAFVLQGEWK